MDNIPLSKKETDAIYFSLADCMLDALEREEVENSQVVTISDFVLDNIKKIKTNAEMMLFLEEVHIRWPYFEKVFLKFKGTEEQRGDEKKLQDTKARLSQLMTK